MRNIKYLLIAIAAVLSVISCKKDDTGYTEIAIYYKCKSMTILDDDTETTAIFTAQSSWYISIDTTYQSWLSASLNSGPSGHYEITLYTEPNTTFDSRKGYVTIIGETQQNTLTITQKGLQVIEFADPVFEDYCLKNFDTDTSGYVTTAEAHKAKKLECQSLGIGDFEGIEFFTNITSADLSNNNMVTLSVSKNTKLEKLDVNNCSQLGGFEVGNEMSNLTEFNCSNCQIPSLQIDSCVMLKTLNCSNNQIASLNLTENSLLSTLNCKGNLELTSVFILDGQTIENVEKDEYTMFVYPSQKINIPDPVFKTYLLDNFDKNRDNEISVEEAMEARDIRCFGYEDNPKNVKSLEGIEYFPNIEYLECSYTQIESLDLTCNPKLEQIYCHSNPLTDIRISTYSPLEMFNCSNCPNLDYLSLNKNHHLESLNASNCGLESVDFSYCSSLYIINISDNHISNINFTSNDNLVYLNCSNNNIENMTVRNCDSLAYLFCGHNQISKLDIDHEYIYDLDISNNKFTDTLDFSDYMELHTIKCDSNEITGLTIPKSEILTSVSLQYNKVSKLDLSSLPELRYIYAEGNNLTEVNTTSSEKLEKIYLNINSFKGSVDFSMNRNMTQLWLQDNPLLDTIWGPKGVESLDIRHDDKAVLLYK